MSYNNFSYYNGPPTTKEWWPTKETKKSAFEEERLPQIGKQQTLTSQWSHPVIHSDYNKQPLNQNVVQNYGPITTKSNETRSADTSQVRTEVIEGTVTQLFSNFGYINDNIIFSKSDIIGQMVKPGDKVVVNATFQPNNPTKYKGERVCKIEDVHTTPTENSIIGKPNIIPQSTTPRVEGPPKKRWDVKQVGQPIVARMDFSLKAPIDNTKISQTAMIGRDITTRIPSDTKHDTQTLPPRMDLSSSNSTDNKNITHTTIMPRVDNPATKTDVSSLLTRIDLTVPSKNDTPSPTLRTDSSVKNKIEIPRSTESISSNKRIDETKEKNSNSKDKSIDEKDKSRHIDTKTKKLKVTKSQLLRKTETAKRKANSPIKFHVSSKESTSSKRSSESKNKCVFKNYESFAYRELDCAAIKNQFKTLTLPKEFFHVSLKYQHSFPLNHPMKLGNNCHFKIMDKKVKSIDSFIDAQLNKDIDPEDADTTFVAKVMLLSTDDLAKFYKDVLTLAEEFEGENKIPITKAIKFLVGSVGEDKEFGIGGSWSASLDGADPETNPRVLINTAIRTCKAITGIDLSNCSSWPKFLELHYYRPLQKKTAVVSSGKSGASGTDVVEERVEYREPRMETVVYYVPDVWSCVPSPDTWTEVTRSFREQLTCLMCPPPLPASVSTKCEPLGPAVSASATSSSTTEDTKKTTVAADGLEQDEEDWNCNETDSVDEKLSKNSEEDSNMEEQPTHFSKLVVAGMKIVDIKKELELRKLNNRGVMEQLKARLKAVLDREEALEKTKDTATSAVAPVTVVNHLSTNVLTDDQKNELKKLYSLPGQPHIIVHQNRKLFGDQMKLRTMSLHSLLSYYNVKLQETTFELAVFAKQFLEMLRRDAVFNIYKSIVVAPEADLINVEETSKKAKLMVTTSKRTINRPLLFSCSLLDREKTNKISLEDLKILIEGLGICLSTKQLSAVLDKVKDSSKYFNYRQLTDKEMTDSDIAKMLNIDMSEDLDYIKELALGNKALFDSEDVQIDATMNEDELDRLRNELDKSERCRQSIELKVAELKDETKKKIDVSQAQAKEIGKLKEQVAEFKVKYRKEQDLSDRYKGDYNKLFREVKDIDIMTANLNKVVTDTLNKHKRSSIKERSLVPESKNKIEKATNKAKKTTNVVMDVTRNTDICADQSKDVDMTSKIVEDDCQDKIVVKGIEPDKEEESVANTSDYVNNHMDEFELSKSSDYDMISLDEIDI